MGSIEGRLHIGLSLSLALLIGAAWWLGHDALHRSTEAHVLSRLRHDTEALLGKLRATRDGVLTPDCDGMMPIYSQPFSGHYFKVLSGDETIRSRSLWDQDIEAGPLTPGGVAQWHADGPNGQRLLVRGAGYRVGGSEVTLVLAEDLTPLLSALVRFERVFTLLAIGGLTLMLLIQRFIVRAGFRRLEPVYRDIEGLEHGTTSRLAEDTPAEILPLVRKLNRLLAVYDKRLSRSRNAAGNLAHALKGPLNLMIQQLSRPGDALDAQIRRRCREEIDRVRALIERELKRARIAGGGAPGAMLDPRADLPVLGDLLKRIYRDKPLEIHSRLDHEGTLPLDREDMLELIGTLLDNACKWSRGTVHCSLEVTRDGIRIRVEDDGPGCTEAEMTSIVERGVRLDEGIDGHGLGLSIARDIVDSYAGRLSIGRSESLGGFSAQVDLPTEIPATR